MYHMKATVRDLRYHFSRIEDLLGEGHEIEITKRKRVIAKLVPPSHAAPGKRPDFLGRLKKIYGDKVLEVTGAELLAEERDRY